MSEKKYITLKDLEVYQLSRNLSSLAWKIYSKMSYEEKKIIGDQFIRSVDSVGANIAEGYARFHYLEKVRFYHISRASLSESIEHWAELMLERNIVSNPVYQELMEIHKPLQVKLNNFIASTLNAKKK
jgi:four helix bundle protein